MIGRGPRGELDGRDPKTPDIRFEIVAFLLQASRIRLRLKNTQISVFQERWIHAREEKRKKEKE